MTVNRSAVLYWTITGVMAVFMFMASIPDLLQANQAIAIFTHLGYPLYLLRFLGAAKCLGVITILAPGVPRLKEWAFAGLIFDLLGALYSHLSVGDSISVWLFPVLGLTLVAGAYLAHRTKSSSRAWHSVDVNAASRVNQPAVREVAARAVLPTRYRRNS